MLKQNYGLRKVSIHTDWLDVPVLLDPAGVSIILGCKYQTVVKALQQGRLPGQKVLGAWLVRKDELMAHLGFEQWEIERYGFGMPTTPKSKP